jgi:hypothetical protein
MQVTLKFLRDLPLYQREKPYTLHGFPDIPAEQQTNCEYEEISDIEAHDLRGSTDMPVLEEQGFEYLIAPSHCNLSASTFEQDLPSDYSVDPVSAYLQETMDIVKEKLNASLAVTIDWRVGSNYHYFRFINTEFSCSFDAMITPQLHFEINMVTFENKLLQLLLLHTAVSLCLDMVR